jgi:DNA-binding IclR family transcriptional regulator
MAKRTSPVKQSYAAPALEKGLDVLELLAGQPGGLTKSEVARALQRTISEIFRMLVTLEERGYIAHGPDERYALTLKLFQLVQEHPPTERLLAEALPEMHHLAHVTMQSCHLGVMELGSVTIVAQVNPPTRVGFFVRQGSTLDMLNGASGYVLLAYQTPAQQQRMLEEWRRETGRRPPRDLQAHLARIRKAGFERRESYEVKGIVNISSPVFDERGAAMAALTVPYIQHTLRATPMANVVQALRKASAEITAKLGGVAPQN